MQSTALHNEKELLIRISQGDASAYRILFDNYWNSIYSFSFKITKSEQIAAEIAQEVFIKIWLKRVQLPDIDKIDSYLFIAARNRCYNALRNKKKEESFIRSLSRAPAESPTPEHYIFARQSADLIQKAISLLPEQQKAVYILQEQHGLKAEQIADYLNISKDSVRVYVRRAIRSIRLFLQLHTTLIFVVLPASVLAAF